MVTKQVGHLAASYKTICHKGKDIDGSLAKYNRIPNLSSRKLF